MYPVLFLEAATFAHILSDSSMRPFIWMKSCCFTNTNNMYDTMSLVR